jgi:hypothetical protein
MFQKIKRRHQADLPTWITHQIHRHCRWAQLHQCILAPAHLPFANYRMFGQYVFLYGDRESYQAALHQHIDRWANAACCSPRCVGWHTTKWGHWRWFAVTVRLPGGPLASGTAQGTCMHYLRLRCRRWKPSSGVTQSKRPSWRSFTQRMVGRSKLPGPYATLCWHTHPPSLHGFLTIAATMLALHFVLKMTAPSRQYS